MCSDTRLFDQGFFFFNWITSRISIKSTLFFFSHGSYMLHVISSIMLSSRYLWYNIAGDCQQVTDLLQFKFTYTHFAMPNIKDGLKNFRQPMLGLYLFMLEVGGILGS
ncbi:hypothetical protein KFK09_011962 [Dendrobium nobile]|uniref:Uncharacterized protein n=1 Tax=Dendrobium nobile TaxID=94219 RepID=A0A8T3BFZ2_DENNO|nr:hypothetical protein KFK09_011962 [Dendrobium nobile]